MQVGLHRIRAPEGLADADGAVIGQQPDEADVGLQRGADGGQLDDAHT
jgi:hypothetical protein